MVERKELSSESQELVALRKKAQQQTHRGLRLQAEFNLLLQLLIEGGNYQIHYDLNDLQSKGILPFYFVLKDTSCPYDNFKITGYISIPSGYPQQKPKILFKPLLPHINVYKKSTLIDVGYHCGGGFSNWDSSHTLQEALYKARDIVCNPYYAGDSLECILKKALKEKGVDYYKYYVDDSIKRKVDATIVEMLNNMRYEKFE